MFKVAALSFLFLISTAAAFEDISITAWLNKNNFTVLSNLLQATGLATALDGTGPFTVFAPTDEAFSKVPPALFSELQADKNKLATVLKYHVLSGFVLGPQISDGTSATTLDGQDVNLHKTANGAIRVNGANVTRADQVLNNGVVHVIDAVLVPDTTTLTDVLLQRPNDFGDLVLLLTITDLIPALNGGPYTIFAPTNAAFDAIALRLPSFSSTNAKQIYADLLLHHVVDGTYMSSSLQDGSKLTTLHNSTLTVSTSGGVTLNPSGAKVTIADIQAVNGVVHAIDAVMIPSDLQITRRSLIP